MIVWGDLQFHADVMRGRLTALACATFLSAGNITSLYAQDDALASLLREMRSARLAINGATSSEQKAEAWLQLQSAADSLVRQLNQRYPTPYTHQECYDRLTSLPSSECPGQRYVREAWQLGMRSISYCGAGESLLPGVDGFAWYLRLWPHGPKADEAWWRTHVEPPCCDECSPTERESYQQVTGALADFIHRFPTSARSDDARARISAYRRLLEHGSR